MTAEIEGKQKPLCEVFGGDYVYRIPLYQRPYAWTKENAGLLYDDLVAAIGEEGTPVDDLDPYFLGSVVLIKEHAKPSSDVVDGQQRLTTLSILLAALRETVQDGKDDLTKWLFVTGNKFTRTEAQYRLTLRDRDASFFRTHVQEPAGFSKLRALDPAQLDEAQQRIRENALLLVGRLSTLEEAERQRLAEFMMTRCYLIVVSTPNLNAAYRIFSVLNERGLDLSYTDILKAEVIGRIADAKQGIYAKHWEGLEAELGREDFEAVFAHVRTVYKKSKPRGTILEEFRKAVKPSEKPESFLDQVLTPLSDAYQTIRDADYESSAGADAVNHQLRRLNRIDNFDWMPAAMLYLWRGRPTAAALAAFLGELERQAAMMMIARANVNQRIERFGKVMEELEKGREPFRPGSPVLADDAQDRRLARERLTGDVYGEKKTRLFILTRLDEELSDGGATYDREITTVEHVLPQTPAAASQWLKSFPDASQREMWTGRLANLVLLSRRKNGEAQNYEFDVKKTKYFQSTKTKSAPFALTTEVLQQVQWTPTVLETRQARLLGVLEKAWRL